MAEISNITGHTSDAERFQIIASKYSREFLPLAISRDGKHLKLAYQLDDSWGMLYNLFMDRLLNLNIMPQSLYDMQERLVLGYSSTYPCGDGETWIPTGVFLS